MQGTESYYIAIAVAVILTGIFIRGVFKLMHIHPLKET